jgi:exonuclease SbcD
LLLLHLADVHLERAFQWLGPERGPARRQELRNTLTEAVALAVRERVDALVIAGDLFERENAGPALGDYLSTTFARLHPTPVLIAPGNHDYVSPGSLYDRVTWPANVHVFRGTTLQPLPLADGTIWGRAFVAADCPQSPLAGFAAPGDGPHLGLFHADVVEAGAASPYAPLDPAALAASGLAFAMLGHVHAGRIDRARGFAYPGSLVPLDLSETGAHTALRITASAGGWEFDPVVLTHRQALTETLDLSGIATFADLRQQIDAHRLDWEGQDLRLRLVGTLGGELLLRPEAIRDALVGLDVELEISARPAVDLAALAGQRTVLGAFVRAAREKQAQAPDPTTRQQWADALAVGVAAFLKTEPVLPEGAEPDDAGGEER